VIQKLGLKWVSKTVLARHRSQVVTQASNIYNNG
jgi:hypothetical protein